MTFAPLGGTFQIQDGSFNLFKVDPQTGMRLMTYAFRFSLPDGEVYFLNGRKEIHDDRHRIDVIEDMTRLFTTIHKGGDKDSPIYGAGELYFKLKDAPAMAASMKVEGASSWQQRLAALTAFGSFAFGALRNEYLADIRLLYDTQYENLVLSGELESDDGRPSEFFFVSGVHDKGFPWGDTELFWDVLLVVADGDSYRRYAITDRVLEGLELDITAGRFRYRGPLFAIREGYSASFSQMRNGAMHLTECQADFEIDFQANAFASVTFPFPLVSKLVRKMSSAMGKALRQVLPGEQPLGINITPHNVSVRSAIFHIHDSGSNHWKVVAERTSGEAEYGTFRNVKEPTLLYGYLCALRPDDGTIRVQIQSRTMRNERSYWLKDRLDAFLGTVIARTSSAELLIQNNQLSVKPLPPAGKPNECASVLRKQGDPLIEVNNDHFPTGVFQRRVVKVGFSSGEDCFALEEDMSAMRLEAVNSTRKAKVASVKNENKLMALDQVLEITDFDSLLDEKLSETGRSKSEFQIAIKPNFMFAYNKRDRSTYTDPELVDHLARRLRARGYENIRVVEAQSTYGEFFDKRCVTEMAEYLGFNGSAGYSVIDMTRDAAERQYLGPNLGLHPVSSIWRNADFRISFAKNKTHAYSYYTLTLKNIYGALPLANKFKEYHCDRDIYKTTIEYLKAFPVDYGLVDAYLSADGPFGIFADPVPNETHTIIGGTDLVAVDWVAASKMGIDPMISNYMKLAVEEFGKPEIQLIGDPNPYRPWLNVPVALNLFTHRGMDANHYFGNLLYMVSAQMDESHFRHKSNAVHIRLLRKLTVPLRRTFFVRTGENPTIGNRLMSWLLYRLGY